MSAAKLKAWRIACGDYDMLVFADSRNKAREISVSSGPVYMDYMDVRAYRHSSLDGFADRENLMLCNRELPDGCPRFWSDEA